MSNALTIDRELDSIAPQIAALLPPDVSPDKFREVALAAIRQKPELARCDRQSLFNACLAAAQDGLMPDGREGAIVPRKGQAVWQPMIQGIYKRVKTSGSVASISANVVYADEVFDVLLGDEDRIVHRRDMSKVVPGNEVAVYAIATLKDGTKEREIMTWEQVLVVRQASATPNAGPWVQWPDEMARKTVVRRLAKRLPVIDPADEALHRTIGRVDSLYDFGTAQPAAPTQQAATPPIRAAAATMQRTARITGEPSHNDAPVPPSNTRRTAPPPMGWQGRITALRIAFRDCKTADEVDQILCGEDVAKMRETFKDVAAEELETLIAETSQKWWPEEGEVEIAGAENVASG